MSIVHVSLPTYVQNSSIGAVNLRTEPTTFTAVYQSFRHKIYSYVLYRVGFDREVAEDIVSDVFVKAYEKFDTYNPSYALSTWLYTITRNTLIDHYRRGRDVIDIDDIPLADEGDPFYRLLNEQISFTEVEAAIAALPEPQRVCLTEQFFAGKTGATIAAEHQLSHAAVRQHVSRGIARLREQLLLVGVIVGGSSFVYWIV